MRSFVFKIAFVLIGMPILWYVLSGFVMMDRKSDLLIKSPSSQESIQLQSLANSGDEPGSFVSEVDFGLPKLTDSEQFFIGQKIIFTENSDIDSILIGVTSKLTSKYEIWHNNKIVKTDYLGFMKKVTLGSTYTLRLEFEKAKLSNKNSKNRIVSHIYQGSHFFGDTGTLVIDLSEATCAVQAVQNFAHLPLQINTINFMYWKFWNNYKSFD
ncbi:MAG: hypothetical protein R2774_00095 [Saprospiraceae bacterium]